MIETQRDLFPIDAFRKYLVANFLVCAGSTASKTDCPIGRWLKLRGGVEVIVNKASAVIDGKRHSLPRELREFINRVDDCSESVTGAQALRILRSVMNEAD